MGEGLVRNTAKISASAVSAFSPPDSSVSAWVRLPGGQAKISRPELERIVGIDQFQLRRAAAEQRLEQPPEMPVHRVEGFEQALAALAIEIGNALPQPHDGFLDIGLLPLHFLELGGKLSLFLLGSQIDAAQPLAVAFEFEQPRLDIGERWNGGARLQSAKRQAVFRRAVELIADRASGLATALTRRLEPRLAARARLARLGKPLLHLAQGLLAAFQRRLGQSQIVRGFRPLALGGGNRIEQFHAPLLDLGREIFQRGEVCARLFLARAQREDLLARIGDTLLPQPFFRADRLQALLAEPDLALETFKRGVGACRGLAAGSGFHLCRFECGFKR